MSQLRTPLAKYDYEKLYRDLCDARIKAIEAAGVAGPLDLDEWPPDTFTDPYAGVALKLPYARGARVDEAAERAHIHCCKERDGLFLIWTELWSEGERPCLPNLNPESEESLSTAAADAMVEILVARGWDARVYYPRDDDEMTAYFCRLLRGSP